MYTLRERSLLLHFHVTPKNPYSRVKEVGLNEYLQYTRTTYKHTEYKEIFEVFSRKKSVKQNIALKDLDGRFL